MKRTFFLMVTAFLLVACGGTPTLEVVRSASATPSAPTPPFGSPTATSTPEATATPTPTEAPKIDTPAEIDIHPMTTETAHGEILGVPFTTNVIADKSLSLSIRGFKRDDSYKNFDKAMTSLTARIYYDQAIKRGGPDGTGIKKDDGTKPTQEEYLQMIKEAREGKRSYKDVQFIIKVNDISTAGYVLAPVTFWPCYKKADGAEIPAKGEVVLEAFSIVFYRRQDWTITNQDTRYGFGSNYLGDTLYFYRGIDTSQPISPTGFDFVVSLSGASQWLSVNTFPNFYYGTTEMMLLSNNSNSISTFRSVFKIIPK